MRKINFFISLLFTVFYFGQQLTYVDFSNANTTSGNWNNLVSSTVSQVGMSVNLIDDTGASTGAVMSVTDSFNQINENGTTSPDSSLPFPASATRDSFFGNDVLFNSALEPTGKLEITGLNPAKYYSFKIFASRTGVSDNREAEYSITGSSTSIGYLNASNNTTNICKLYNIFPDATGKITINVKKGPNNNNSSGFYYLGALLMIKTDTLYSDVIGAPTLSLNYPNGGEVWHSTATPYIGWDSANLTGNVNIEYSLDNGTTWQNLASVSSSEKKYVWTIPYVESSQCKVRITSGTITDVSDNVFSIIPNTNKRYKIVVLGSSTAAGTGPSSVDKAWVWMYTDYLKEKDTRFDVVNLAVGGYTTYKILPTGSTVPAGVTVDTDRNITKAIALKADGIIVSMPSNDSNMGYTADTQMNNYHTVVNAAAAVNIPTWICTVQPRNFGTGTAAQNIQNEMVTRIPAEFPTTYIDFWNGIAAADGSVLPAYNAGDGIHLNDAAHVILLQRVIGKNLHAYVSSHDNNNADYQPTEKNYLLDFNLDNTNYVTSGNWNNLGNYTNGSLTGLVDDLGNSSTININVSDAFSLSNDLGVTVPTGSNIFPATSTRDAFYGDNSNPSGIINITGLNPAKVYDFTLFASRKDQTDNQETKFTLTGANSKNASLNASSNSSSVAVIEGISPNSSGKIEVMVTKGANNNNANGYYYINTLKLKEKEIAQSDVLMDCENGTTNRLSPLNVFSNGPGQSNSDMVVVDNPNPSGINTSSKVVRFTRRTSGTDAASWAGFYSYVVDPDPDFTINKYIHVKVLKYKTTGVRFKIEGGAAGTVEKLSMNSYTNVGQWQDMVINFSEKTGIYSTVGLQPDYESPLVADGDRIIYFDDIILNNDPNPITTLSSTDFNLKNKIVLYPNPVKNEINIETEAPLKSIVIISIEGRQLKKFDNINSGIQSLNIEELSKGLYFVKFVTKDGTILTKKIIKE